MAKTQLMFDMRCPSCNRPLKGKEDVVHRASTPKIEACPSCKTKVFLVKADAQELVNFFWSDEPVAVAK